MTPRVHALGLALLAGIGFACSEDPSDIPSVGTLERPRIELTAEAREPIIEIAVREGDRVEAGQLLARLDDTRMRAQAARAEAARDEAGARLAEAQRGPRAERIAEAKARLSGARSVVANAKSELERAQALAESHFESESRLDELRARHDEAVARRDEARAALEALLEGTTVEELDQAKSALAAAQASLADVAVQLERLSLRAPRVGRIDALPFEVGERPPAGAVVVIMLGADAPYARVHVPAPVRVRLRPGAPARVWVDGYDEPFEGTVRLLSSDAAFTPYYALTQHDRSRLAYVAEVDLTDPAAADLPTGIPVEVRFDLPQIASGEQ